MEDDRSMEASLFWGKLGYRTELGVARLQRSRLKISGVRARGPGLMLHKVEE